MEKELYRIRKAVECMHQLMEEVVSLQRGCHQCCRTVDLLPALPSPTIPHLIPPPDPLAGQPDMVLAASYASRLLGRSDRQLARYRADGKLEYVDDDGEGRSGYRLSQLRRLHFDLWGKWPE